jgi:hypothetical protein
MPAGMTPCETYARASVIKGYADVLPVEKYISSPCNMPVSAAGGMP